MGAEITREEVLSQYKDYQDTFPEGIEDWHAGRIEPLTYEIPEGAKILDIGCNSGAFMELLRDKRKCDVYGVDVADVLEKAKTKGLNVQAADAENLPFDSGTFDVVTLLEVLNHIHDPLKALQEAKRVLKADGIILGSVPHKNLERYVWEEKKFHHPYFDVENLGVLLDKVWKFSHLWPLKGAQFSLKFSDSFLAGQTTEILFKCGDSGDHKWWSLMQKKKVLRVWFGPTQHEGTTYYRMHGFADKMRKKGIEAGYEAVTYAESDDHARWQNRCRNRIVLDQLDAILKVSDVSVWQVISNADALAMLRCARDVVKKPILTEVDDWLFDIPQYNIASGPYKPNSALEWLILRQLFNSDALIVSTQFIKEKMQEIQQLKDTPMYVIPNSIDFDIWDKLNLSPPGKREGVVRIGYSGCSNHGGDMFLVRDVIKTILDEFPNTEFVWAVPMKDPHDPNKEFSIQHERAKCVNQWYKISDFPQVLKNWDLDIGIAPLVDNNFNRAKSNLRWLEYSALKVPCVASRVEPFKKSIVHNLNGYVCSGLNEWYKTLRELILYPEQRKRIGEEAYREVKRNYNMDLIADRYIGALEEMKCKGQTLKPRSDGSVAIPTMSVGQPPSLTPA